MKLDNYVNIFVSLLAVIGFVMGFINSDYRILVWSVSFIVIFVVILLFVVRDYLYKIDENERQINWIKKDLNILNRLSRLEGKFDLIEKRLR